MEGANNPASGQPPIHSDKTYPTPTNSRTQDAAGGASTSFSGDLAAPLSGDDDTARRAGGGDKGVAADTPFPAPDSSNLAINDHSSGGGFLAHTNALQETEKNATDSTVLLTVRRTPPITAGDLPSSHHESSTGDDSEPRLPRHQSTSEPSASKLSSLVARKNHDTTAAEDSTSTPAAADKIVGFNKEAAHGEAAYSSSQESSSIKKKDRLSRNRALAKSRRDGKRQKVEIAKEKIRKLQQENEEIKRLNRGLFKELADHGVNLIQTGGLGVQPLTDPSMNPVTITGNSAPDTLPSMMLERGGGGGLTAALVAALVSSPGGGGRGGVPDFLASAPSTSIGRGASSIAPTGLQEQLTSSFPPSISSSLIQQQHHLAQQQALPLLSGRGSISGGDGGLAASANSYNSRLHPSLVASTMITAPPAPTQQLDLASARRSDYQNLNNSSLTTSTNSSSNVLATGRIGRVGEEDQTPKLTSSSAASTATVGIQENTTDRAAAIPTTRTQNANKSFQDLYTELCCTNLLILQMEQREQQGHQQEQGLVVGAAPVGAILTNPTSSFSAFIPPASSITAANSASNATIPSPLLSSFLSSTSTSTTNNTKSSFLTSSNDGGSSTTSNANLSKLIQEQNLDTTSASGNKRIQTTAFSSQLSPPQQSQNDALFVAALKSSILSKNSRIRQDVQEPQQLQQLLPPGINTTMNNTGSTNEQQQDEALQHQQYHHHQQQQQQQQQQQDLLELLQRIEHNNRKQSKSESSNKK